MFESCHTPSHPCGVVRHKASLSVYGVGLDSKIAATPDTPSIPTAKVKEIIPRPRNNRVDLLVSRVVTASARLNMDVAEEMMDIVKSPKASAIGVFRNDVSGRNSIGALIKTINPALAVVICFILVK